MKMGHRSLGHCGNSWTFYNDCLYFSFISYYLVCVCLHNHHHYTIHFFVVGLTCVWLARPITINASFVLNCRGQQHHSQTSGEQRCDGVFWIVPFIEKKFHLRKQCRVLCVCCCLNVLWSHLYDVIWCYLLLFVVRCSFHSDSFRFIPIHSASISWNNFTLGNCTQQIWSMYHRRAKVRNWPNQAMVFWNNWTTTPRGVYHRKILWRIKVFEMIKTRECVYTTCVHPQQDDRWSRNTATEYRVHLLDEELTGSTCTPMPSKYIDT